MSDGPNGPATTAPARGPALLTLALMLVAYGCCSVFVSFVGWFPYSVPAFFSGLLGAFSGGFYLYKPAADWMRRYDWRIWAIVLMVDLVLVFTLLVLGLGVLRDVSDFWGAAFAGWVSSVAFFAVAGGLIAVFSVTRPEEDAFEARARILFRRQRGAHIDYIVSRMREVFEHYAERAKYSLCVERMHAGERKFYVCVKNRTQIRNYITDIETEYMSRVAHWELTEPPANEEPNQLLYVRINNKAKAGQVYIGGEIDEIFPTQIKNEDVCLVESGVKHWVREETEDVEHQAQRYTQSFELHVENNLAKGVSLLVSVKTVGEQAYITSTLPPGGKHTLGVFKDVRPKQVLFSIRLKVGP